MGKKEKHLTKQGSRRLNLLEEAYAAPIVHFPPRMSRCINNCLINCLMPVKERAESIMAQEENAENETEEI